jgi:hypothetical protein
MGMSDYRKDKDLERCKNLVFPIDDYRATGLIREERERFIVDFLLMKYPKDQ